VPYSGRYSTHRHQETRDWRPRSPPKTNPYTDMAPVSSRAPQPAQGAPSQAVSDSQRTILDQLGHLELGETNGDEHPKSPPTETAEERLRIIKGKAHVIDTPTSREREPCLRPSSIIIREPADRHQDHQSTNSLRHVATSPGDLINAPKHPETDLDIYLGQDLEIALTEDDLALVD
ncbi:unnamed protein product, partial [Brassica oleracea]